MNESTSSLVISCATFFFLGFIACVLLYYAFILIDSLLDYLHSRYSKLEKVTITLTFNELVELNKIFDGFNSGTKDLLQQKIMRPYYKNKYFVKELALIEDKKLRKEEQKNGKNDSNSGNN